MFITKILETSVDLLGGSSNEIYDPALETLLLKKLNERYVQKCFQSILIVEVVRIIRRSYVTIVDNRLEGDGSVDVQFEVKGVIFNQGEILHGCEVIEIHDGAITAKHPYASIKLQKDTHNKVYSMLTAGQKIPVVVRRVRYNPNQTTVSMSATPYVPEITPDRYIVINSKLSPAETEKLTFLLDEINKELAEHKEIKEEKSYEFFRDILYPYKTQQKFEQTKIATTMKFKPVDLELKKLLEIENGIVVYPDGDPKHYGRIFISAENPELLQVTGSLIINSSLYTFLADTLSKYLMYMQALRGFLQTYPTPISLQPLMAYWKICKQLQA